MFILFMFLSIVLMAQNVFAATAQITYTEPTQNVAGNPLTNLRETSIYWKQDGGTEQIIRVPASSTAGGAPVSRNITIADPPLCGTTIVTAQVTASNTNTSNFESARTPQATGSKSNIPPGCSVSNAPTGLSITIP